VALVYNSTGQEYVSCIILGAVEKDVKYKGSEVECAPRLVFGNLIVDKID
jgi:hypothetical protein